MRHFRDPQGDLFETPRPVAAIQTEDRAELLTLLRVLVTEAFAMPVAGAEKTPKEAGDE